jgi:hypothetical protein
MAITSGTANVQILVDTPTRTVAKFLYFTANGTPEADTLKVNAAALSYGAHTLVLRNNNVQVISGAVVTGATSNASAYVVDWQRATNTVLVTQLTGNTAFADNEVLTFTFGNTTATVNSAASSAFATPTRNLDITSIWYSVMPGMLVELGFAGQSANSPSVLLSSSGYFGKNALPTQIDNGASSPTGNFFISTPVAGANTGYTVIVEFRKTTGFAAVPGY